MQPLACDKLVTLAPDVVKNTRKIFNDPNFQQKYRVRAQDFTRRRALSFPRVVVFVLQKTVRSIQLHLQDFLYELGDLIGSLTPSAWTQARAKLKHGAFIELNQRAILEAVYAPGSEFAAKRWHQFRLLAIDSSLLRLPNEKEMGESFGWVECENQKGHCGAYAQGRLSVLTDVLNRIAVESLLVPWKEDERSLAAEHLGALQETDLSLLDRGYAAYELFAQFIQAKRAFVCRCSNFTFGAVNRLFAANQAGQSVIVKLKPANGTMGLIRDRKLPETITVRLVTLRLSTGELEVLATNLLDEKDYPTELFGEVYNFRWKIETYYGLIKSRLDLENFSGRTVESVYQDVHATVFLSNLEGVLTSASAQKLADESVKNQQNHPKAVNHAVSFHAIKSRIVDLLLSHKPVEEVLPRISRLFLQNPVTTRKRQVPRKKISAWRSYHYQRTVKKTVF
jgi:hypothetical protein